MKKDISTPDESMSTSEFFDLSSLDARKNFKIWHLHPDGNVKIWYTDEYRYRKALETIKEITNYSFVGDGGLINIIHRIKDEIKNVL